MEHRNFRFSDIKVLWLYVSSQSHVPRQQSQWQTPYSSSSSVSMRECKEPFGRRSRPDGYLTLVGLTECSCNKVFPIVTEMNDISDTEKNNKQS